MGGYCPLNARLICDLTCPLMIGKDCSVKVIAESLKKLSECTDNMERIRVVSS